MLDGATTASGVIKIFIVVCVIIYIVLYHLKDLRLDTFTNSQSNRHILLGGNYANVLQFDDDIYLILLFPQQMEILNLKGVFYYYTFENCKSKYVKVVALNEKMTDLCLPSAQTLLKHYKIKGKRIYSIETLINSTQDIVNYLGRLGAFEDHEQKQI